MSEAQGHRRSHGPKAVRSFSHRALFREEQSREHRCEVCGLAISPRDDDGAMPAGSGLLVWTRGDEVRYDEPPLCPTCSAALGMAQVRRWDTDDEEG